MKARYRLIRRNERLNKFYCLDSLTGKRASLHTQDEDAAEQMVLAKNQALRQPALNLQIAKAYLAGTDSGVTTRTWNDALGVVIDTKQGENKLRWERAAKDAALRELLNCVLMETPAELVLQALKVGSVSTNVFLRRLHNFCLAMNWLPWPIVPRKQWPAVRFKEKRAITLEEHRRSRDQPGTARLLRVVLAPRRLAVGHCEFVRRECGLEAAHHRLCAPQDRNGGRASLQRRGRNYFAKPSAIGAVFPLPSVWQETGQFGTRYKLN